MEGHFNDPAFNTGDALRPTHMPRPPLRAARRHPAGGASAADMRRTRNAGSWIMKMGSMAPLVPPAQAERTFYTPEQVAEHCTADDAWMILNGRVYDITMYAADGHPVANALKPYFGKDGTAMKNKIHGYVSCHALLRPFFVGRLAVPEPGRAGVGITEIPELIPE